MALGTRQPGHSPGHQLAHSSNPHFLPDSGQKLAVRRIWAHNTVMADPELVRRIAESCGLSWGEADRVITDVVSYYQEPAPDFVRRRHRELQSDGHRNQEVYRRLLAEIRTRVFAAPDLTERQVRRIIYG